MDVDESTLSAEEQKERKIMKLLLKIKNGTPPMRKVSASELYDTLLVGNCMRQAFRFRVPILIAIFLDCKFEKRICEYL